MDPLAERHPERSPYEYVLSNPINYDDPDGMTERNHRSRRIRFHRTTGLVKTLLDLTAVQGYFGYVTADNGTKLEVFQAINEWNPETNKWEKLPRGNRYSVHAATDCLGTAIFDGWFIGAITEGGGNKLMKFIEGNNYKNITNDGKYQVGDLLIWNGNDKNKKKSDFILHHIIRAVRKDKKSGKIIWRSSWSGADGVFEGTLNDIKKTFSDPLSEKDAILYRRQDTTDTFVDENGKKNERVRDNRVF